MVGERRVVWLTLVALSLAVLSGCARPSETANKEGSQPSAAQPSTPAILPKDQSKPGLGSIKVGSRPTGAAILLISEEGADGGRPQLRGSTPTTVTDVVPGKYTVHLELRGYKAFQKIVEVQPDQTVTVTADLLKQ